MAIQTVEQKVASLESRRVASWDVMMVDLMVVQRVV